MDQSGQNEGLRILDDFVCSAIQDSVDIQNPPSKRSDNEGIRPLAEIRIGFDAVSNVDDTMGVEDREGSKIGAVEEADIDVSNDVSISERSRILGGRFRRILRLLYKNLAGETRPDFFFERGKSYSESAVGCETD